MGNVWTYSFVTSTPLSSPTSQTFPESSRPAQPDTSSLQEHPTSRRRTSPSESKEKDLLPLVGHQSTDRSPGSTDPKQEVSLVGEEKEDLRNTRRLPDSVFNPLNPRSGSR